MQDIHIHFEATVKDGYIKIPEGYPGLNNQRVVVEILNEDIPFEKMKARGKKIEEYLRKYSGILKDTNIPADITTKEIRKMRLSEKYDL